ncbi:MAG TPA: LysM peptidoglycan-binding domain-containing protein [Chthoniobacterales bacterium]
MTRRLRTFALLLFGLALLVRAEAQSPAPGGNSDGSVLLNLSKKIDEQNLKIDLLSQQILRLQQEIEHPKTAGTEHPIPAATTVSSPLPAGANTHVVARGETLTSIARMHKVTIDELQKLNHIEDARKLQPGQTLVLPATAATPGASVSPAGSASPAASVPNE